MRQIAGRLFLAAVAGIVLAYGASRIGYWEWPRPYDPLALPDLAAPPNLITSWQLSLADMDPEGCARMLRRAGMDASLQRTRSQGASCRVTHAVKLARLSSARIRPEETRCVVAARLYLWEKHVLQPAAERLLGQGIAEILHFGSYSCRTMRGSSRMSEHATANAFDIAGFRLASGKIISVKANWYAPAKESRFLRLARDGLCDWFNVTLSPDYNADHADHFHVDMGWYQTCR
jgi:hypothetical protein